MGGKRTEDGLPVAPSPWLGFPNAASTYEGNDTLDNPTPEQNPVEPKEYQTIQLVTVGPLTAREASKMAALAGSMLLGDDRYRMLQAGDDHDR